MKYCKCHCGQIVERDWAQGHHRRGVALSASHKEKISVGSKNAYMNGVRKPVRLIGERNWRWIKDRTKINTSGRDTSKRYIDYRTNVLKRDNHKCKISNKDCSGALEVHHILRYKDFPELRYDTNNGITLCHFHHPRKKMDEINLSPYFRELVDKTLV